MAFNIAEFNAQLNRHGVAKNNLFLARITAPVSGDSVSTRDLSFLCRSVDIPELTLDTTKVKPVGYGPGFTRPIGMEFQPIPMVFMVDSNFGVKKFFHRWMQQIVHYDLGSGGINTSPSGMLPYEIGYKDEYAGTVEIIVFADNSEEQVYSYRFGSAYPISVGNITAAWENQAEIMTLPVIFSYEEYTVDGSESGAITTRENRGVGDISYLPSISNYGQSIQGISLANDVQDTIDRYTNVGNIWETLT